MSRDKQIEEMHLEFEKWDDADTDLSLSEWLYNAGYRKASEVAREIFAEIEKFCRPPLPECEPIYILRKGELDELKRKYGYGTD